MNNDDNELVTKGYFRKELEKGLSRYFGIMIEEFRERFKAHKDNMSDAPERMRNIEESMQENENEHKVFRVRIGALENP